MIHKSSTALEQAEKNILLEPQNHYILWKENLTWNRASPFVSSGTLLLDYDATEMNKDYLFMTWSVLKFQHSRINSRRIKILMQHFRCFCKRSWTMKKRHSAKPTHWRQRSGIICASWNGDESSRIRKTTLSGPRNTMITLVLRVRYFLCKFLCIFFVKYWIFNLYWYLKYWWHEIVVFIA